MASNRSKYLEWAMLPVFGTWFLLNLKGIYQAKESRKPRADGPRDTPFLIDDIQAEQSELSVAASSFPTPNLLGSKTAVHHMQISSPAPATAQGALPGTAAGFQAEVDAAAGSSPASSGTLPLGPPPAARESSWTDIPEGWEPTLLQKAYWWWRARLPDESPVDAADYASAVHKKSSFRDGHLR